MKRGEGLNAAERFVFDLCRKSFLRLWSYANPQGKNQSKELCDVLVVVPPDVVIFSVKEVRLKRKGELAVEWARWTKRAIEVSAKQIYGAERHVRTAPHVVRSDGSPGLPFPKAPGLRVHRVAVAAGSQGHVPILFGDFGKGFVHVFDESSAAVILSELDTVSDFINYLSEKERFCTGVKHLIQVREEDLLAMYLHAGRRLPSELPDLLSVPDELWDSLVARPEFLARKRADEVSYVWDRLIDRFTEDVFTGSLEPGGSLTKAERALRFMAKEDRFSRRCLGEAFKEFVEESADHPLARMVKSPSGVVYVFLALPRNALRDHRQRELQLRCFVARGLHQEATTTVGVATEQYSPEGYSIDLAVHHQVEWRDEDNEAMMGIQEELGYFVNPRISEQRSQEYPTSDGTMDEE